MDVRGLHLALQFQIQTEMNAMLALVIAAFKSRRRVGCARGILSRLFHIFFSAWGGRYGFMPSSKLDCSGAGCLVYFTPNLFLGTMIKCLIHTKNVDVVNSKIICKLTATIRHDDWHSVDSEGIPKMSS